MIFSYLLNMQSHPSWVCGLKQIFLPHSHTSLMVTPFVGVWIETGPPCIFAEQSPVTPFVGVWIETYHRKESGNRYYVTPFVGVWIETDRQTNIKYLFSVTPFVGVWIETISPL